MIKRWSVFNESSTNISNLEEVLSDKVSDIREFFLDFEDMGIITYDVSPPDNDIACVSSTTVYNFNPKVSKYETFINNAAISINFWLRHNNNLDEQFIYIGANIKLPTIKGHDDKRFHRNSVIGNDGIKLFDNILEANSRLIESGYDVNLDLNANHTEYKPIRILIYFNKDKKYYRFIREQDELLSN